MTITIRTALPQDLETLEEIERLADTLLIELFSAGHWPPPATATERSSLPGFVLVAEKNGKVIGFAQVLEVEGQAHLEQLAVLPAEGRRGYGRALVDAAKEEAHRRGHKRLTLRTYAAVPWNAPFYRDCGFVDELPKTAFERRLIRVEERLGLLEYGPRVQMGCPL